MPAPKPPIAKPTTGSVYQLKVTLRDSKPPIWRRIQVPADITLAKLHRIIQVTMGWSNSHMHQFIVGDAYYGVPDSGMDFGMDMEVKSESKVKLDKVAAAEKSRFVYEYDFGDSWEHQILVEKILPATEGAQYPICLAGKRACPPEDIGGVWGYDGFLEAIKDPEHPEHDDMVEWMDEDFDPEAFDLERINKALKRLA
jgi:Plasmid pRiA4b ORF-3-like protein